MIELCYEYLSVWGIWLYFIVMSRTSFTVNLQTYSHTVIRWCHLKFRYNTFSIKEFLDIQVTVECRFTLILVHNMITTYSQMHHTDKFSQLSSIICPVWLNSWVFFYKSRGCGVESCCCHLNFRYGTCFKQEVTWNSGNYRL